MGLEICELAGLIFDPWQRFLFVQGLAERHDGRFAAFEVAEVVARQNGKGSVLEGRELMGAFGIDEERLIIHSAHEQATSTEHQRRLLDLIEGVPAFDQKVLRVRRGKGEEAIELRGGKRILFKTRTGGSGRGFTGDLVVLDEAMMLAAAFMAALVPTMAARSVFGNPQLWYAGSAVDRLKHQHGIELARVRRRGIEGHQRLLYVEYSADIGRPEEDDPAKVPEEVRLDPKMWAQANPSLGIRISEEYVADEASALGPREFCVERLGIGDWPPLDGEGAVISLKTWRKLEDLASRPIDPIAFAFDIEPNRTYGSVGIAGKRADGRVHLEVIKHERGTHWLPDYLQERVKLHQPLAVLYEGNGPAASLVPELEGREIKLTPVDGPEHARACGMFFDGCGEQDAIRHLGDPDVEAALKGAVKRPLGDAWAWSRKNSATDISPLVALTLAFWGLNTATGGEAWTSSW